MGPVVSIVAPKTRLVFDITDLILRDLILSDPWRVNVESSPRDALEDRRRWTRDGKTRPTRHSCGWLYVEKKVDKLSPGSLKAWAERSTHSSRPLLFFLPLSHLYAHPPSSLTHHHLLLLLLLRRRRRRRRRRHPSLSRRTPPASSSSPSSPSLALPLPLLPSFLAFSVLSLHYSSPRSFRRRADANG